MAAKSEITRATDFLRKPRPTVFFELIERFAIELLLGEDGCDAFSEARGGTFEAFRQTREEADRKSTRLNSSH